MTNSGAPFVSDAVPSTGVPASLFGPPLHPGSSGSMGNSPRPNDSVRRAGSGTSFRLLAWSTDLFDTLILLVGVRR